MNQIDKLLRLHASLKIRISVFEEKLNSLNDELKVVQLQIMEYYRSKLYHYHVEDGQFSFDFYRKELLGSEGDIIKIRENDFDQEIYILAVYDEMKYVECIGRIESTFPSNMIEHEKRIQRYYVEHHSFLTWCQSIANFNTKK